MLRLRVAAIACGATVAGLALGGCSTASAPPPPLTLQFESEPPGANVQTTQGQTCHTPCSLAVPVASQAVVFSMNGYTPQTVQVAVNQPESSWFSHPPPTLAPNPVTVTLQAIPAPPPKPHKIKAPPKTARMVRPPGQPSIAAPERSGTSDNVFPTPPQMAAPASAFPPPPQTR
jgi:hypothetical protein